MGMSREDDIESAARALFKLDRLGTDREDEKWEDMSEAVHDIYRKAVS